MSEPDEFDGEHAEAFVVIVRPDGNQIIYALRDVEIRSRGQRMALGGSLSHGRELHPKVDWAVLTRSSGV